MSFTARDRAFRFEIFGSGHVAGAHLFGEFVGVGAGADVGAAIFAVEHRPARDDDGGQVHTSRAHNRGRCGLVAAGEEHDAVERVGADRLFHVHAGQVAVEHGGGLHQRLAQGHHREFNREAACFVNATLDHFGDDAEMSVAGGEIRPGVADADDGAPVEEMIGVALVFGPTAGGETGQIIAAEPVGAAQDVSVAVVMPIRRRAHASSLGTSRFRVVRWVELCGGVGLEVMMKNRT